MWNYYEGKSIMVTGGSGFLGTAIVHRLLTTTSVSRIYLICRGGVGKLRARWREWLPQGTADAMCDPSRLIVLDGDILVPNLGLSETELEAIRNTTNIIIHAASSINLAAPLKRLHGPVIEATETVANIALSCKMLDRFVYVSTAYSNTYLYPHSQDVDLKIEEEFYKLPSGCDALDELEEVREYGTSTAYEAEDFPWSYGYAKHLTERLLLHRFRESNEKLLIVRPAIIGAAQALPFPGYNMPMSSPYTMFTAALLLFPYRKLTIATRLDQPNMQVTSDEVPVDVVADRLLCHLAMGTTGCVHAVSGARARQKMNSFVQPVMKLRNIPWDVKAKWIKADWKSRKQDALSRLYGIMGTSFNFLETKTTAMYEKLSEKDRMGLQLFKNNDTGNYLPARGEDIRYVMDYFARRSWLAWLIVMLFYYSFGKASQTSRYAKL
ncbi:unnamed protein product [Penicillium salamii]|nr:unnamed protein product [Penicillium salamii]